MEAALQPRFQDATTTNPNPVFQLGVTQYGSTDISGLEAVTSLIDARQSWPLTVFNFDVQDKAFSDPQWQEFIRDNGTPQKGAKQSILRGNGFTTISLSHGPSFTGSSLIETLRNGETTPGPPAKAGHAKSPPVVIYNPITGMDVTIVGIPEIYDIAAYPEVDGACKFPAALCPASPPGIKANNGNCAGVTAGVTETIAIRQLDIERGLENWFADRCNAFVAKASFADAFNTTSQTWPGFSVQRTCDDAKAAFTITGMPGTGCSNFGYYELKDFLFFLQKFGIQTRALRPATQGSALLPVPIMLYEAAFISLPWMSTLGLTAIAE